MLMPKPFEPRFAIRHICRSLAVASRPLRIVFLAANIVDGVSIRFLRIEDIGVQKEVIYAETRIADDLPPILRRHNPAAAWTHV